MESPQVASCGGVAAFLCGRASEQQSQNSVLHDMSAVQALSTGRYRAGERSASWAPTGTTSVLEQDRQCVRIPASFAFPPRVRQTCNMETIQTTLHRHW